MKGYCSSLVATYEFTTPIQVLLNASKVCRGTKKRQEVETDLLSCMAPLVDGTCNCFASFQLKGSKGIFK